MDHTLWLLFCGIGALLMRAGSALHCSGMSRSKNSAGAVMRMVVDLALVSLSFWLIGAALVGSQTGFINWKLIALHRGTVQPAHLFFFLTAILISSSIVVGAVGERSKFFPACAASIALAGVVVPLAARWTLAGGWLARLGFVDLAGAAAIHLSGAAAAFVFVCFLGARMGKYNNDGSSNAIPGHNVPMASVGVLLLFIGWIPYLLGFAGPGPRAGAGASSARVFHSPQASHLPCHLGAGAPQDWQTKRVLSLAMPARMAQKKNGRYAAFCWSVGATSRRVTRRMSRFSARSG